MNMRAFGYRRHQKMDEPCIRSWYIKTCDGIMTYFTDCYIGVFHKHTTLAIMPILASEAWLCENKKTIQ